MHTIYTLLTMCTRQSLKVDPCGPAISNLLHPYLLLPRTNRARVTKQEMVIKQAARARILMIICEIGAFFLWRIFLRGSQADPPEFEKTDVEIRRSS